MRFIGSHGVALSAESLLSGGTTIEGLAVIISEENRKPSVRSERGAEFVDVDFSEVGARSLRELFYVDPTTGVRRGRAGGQFRDVSLSSLGFRSPEVSLPKPEDRVRLAYIGDSITLDVAAGSTEYTWPHRACEMLSNRFTETSFDCVNASMPALKTASMADIFQRYVSGANPDIVVLQPGGEKTAAARLAISAGQYDGIFHGRSKLAKNSPLIQKIEMNALILARQISACLSHRSSSLDTVTLTDAFYLNLSKVVELASQDQRTVILISIGGRLRREQSRFLQIALSGLDLYYAPFLTIRAMLELRASYNEVIAKVGVEHGIEVIDLEATVPFNRATYRDGIHISAEGGKLLASRLCDVLSRRELVSISNREVPSN